MRLLPSSPQSQSSVFLEQKIEDILRLLRIKLLRQLRNSPKHSVYGGLFVEALIKIKQKELAKMGWHCITHGDAS